MKRGSVRPYSLKGRERAIVKHHEPLWTPYSSKCLIRQIIGCMSTLQKPGVVENLRQDGDPATFPSKG